MIIDVAAQLGAVAREVRTDERDGEATKVVVATQTYPTGAADLWDAITSPERIPRWLMPVSGELRLGGRYQLEGNAGGEVTVCEEPTRLSLTWEFGGEVSWVDVVLRADADDRTTLVVEHSAKIDEERWATYGPGAVGVGWELMLMGLDQHLRPGGPAVDPASAAAWSASAEGLRYMTESSEAWGRASVADGTDETAAMAAAARTTAFYTGAPAPEEPGAASVDGSSAGTRDSSGDDATRQG